jgi:uncharacterized repeat protein (TIGR04052 family)
LYKLTALLLGIMLSLIPVVAQTDHQEISVDEAWVRPTTTNHQETTKPEFPAALYLTLTNHTDQDQQLVSVSSDVAETIEIHETTLENDVMRMREIESLTIPAGESVTFDAGGYHIMLIDLVAHLYEGEEVPATLTFESGLTIDFVATVHDLTFADDEHAHHHGSDADEEKTKLHFVAYVGDEVASCGQEYEGVGADGATISFNDFRLYISNIHLITADGELVPFELEQDGIWQTHNVALLDFEDRTAGCSEIGTPSYNGEIVGTAPEGDYTGISFDLGVPFELNHIDATSAPSPLNIAGLWWSWQGGYKFIRVDLMTDAPEHSAWNLHIGSTGCTSPVSVVPPAERCTRPNVASYTFEDFNLADNVVIADLAGLLSSVSLYDNTPMPPGCMAGAEDPDCVMLFPSFGLSLETGACLDGDCASQTFFRIGSQEDVELVGRYTDLNHVPTDSPNSHDNH